jgi:hypothetical protein
MSALYQLLPVIAAVAVSAWGRRAALAAARSDGHYRIVEYPVPLRLLVGTACLGVLYLAARDVVANGGTWAFYDYLYLPLLAGFVPLSLECWIARIRFDDRTLEITSPWRRRRIIPRERLGNIRPGFWGWTIETADAGRVAVNPSQQGHQDLIASIRAARRES